MKKRSRETMLPIGLEGWSSPEDAAEAIVAYVNADTDYDTVAAILRDKFAFADTFVLPLLATRNKKLNNKLLAQWDTVKILTFDLLGQHF